MILHQISQSPFQDSSLSRCLSRLGENDGVMLHGDGVYALMPGHDSFDILQGVTRVFALEVDVQARNVSPNMPHVQLLDYPEWVAQTLAFSHVQSWK